MPDRPLSVLHLTAGSDAGGLSRYIHNICSAMHAQGHQVAVAGERGAWHWLFENAPFPWIEVPFKGGPIDLYRASRTMKLWMREHQVDVIHNHYRRPGWVARRLQKDHRPPILYTLHLSHISLKWPWRYFSDFGDHTHVASGEARDWLINEGRVDPNRITLIPHGIDPALFPFTDDAGKFAAKQRLGFTAFDTIALYVGRLDYPKNCEWLVDLADITRAKIPRLRVLLVGEGPDEAALKQRIADKGLHERVFLMGHRDPLPYYQAADGLLLPSLREGFSFVCAEAMAVGVPVLRTRTSGTKELIIENVTGRSTEIDRAMFLAGAVDFLSDVPKLRLMGQAAAGHVRENFTFEKQLAQTIELYRRLSG